MQGRGFESRRFEYGSSSKIVMDTDNIALAGTIPNDGNYPRIVKVEFPALPTTLNERVAKMTEHGGLSLATKEQCELTRR